MNYMEKIFELADKLARTIPAEGFEEDYINNVASMDKVLQHARYIDDKNPVDGYKSTEMKELLEEAEKVGCQTINGLGMMLYQGAASFKLWTDQDMPIDVVKEALDF